MSRAAAALVLLLGTAGVRGADDPKALIERARRVTGWEAAHKLAAGEYMRTRGSATLRLQESEPLNAVFLQESYRDRQGRELAAIQGESTNVLIDSGDESRRALLPDQWLIRTSSKCWSRTGTDPWKPMDYPPMERTFLYHTGVMRLEGLLEEPAFHLTALPERVTDGAPVTVVRVARTGYVDILLYFDRKRGYLVKTSYRVKEIEGDKKAQKPEIDTDTPVRYETLFKDYREVDFAAADEALLKKAHLAVTGADLVAFLRQRTPTPALQAHLKQRVQELGDDAYAVRERASKDLVTLGAVALPLLREAARSSDQEVARRAQACLKRIKETTEDKYLIAVVHLLALRHPEGAAAALLDYLPTAPAPVAHEVRAALYHLGTDSQHRDSALVAALEDRDPARRAAAEAALGKDGGAYARRPGRRVYPLGIRYPRKIVEVIESKTLHATTTLELLDLQYYNRLDDSLFAPPPKP